MLNILRVFNNDKQLDLKNELKDGKIIYNAKFDNKIKELEIYYDTNIVKNISFKKSIKYTNLTKSKIKVDTSNLKELNIFVDLNYKYFVKAIFKFINNSINIDELLEELNVFKNSNIGKKHLKELNELIKEIDNKPIEELLLQDSNKRIEELLLENKLYLSFAKKMNNRDLMLLITCYICPSRPPKIDQEMFDDLVKSAIEDDDALENVWRLGMTYDKFGFNYNLLDEFFINSRDNWYLSEYVSGVYQVDLNKIVNMIIKTKDKKFIKEFLDDPVMQGYFDDKNIKDLQKSIEK